jgi:hypothetical protein
VKLENQDGTHFLNHFFSTKHHFSASVIVNVSAEALALRWQATDDLAEVVGQLLSLLSMQFLIATVPSPGKLKCGHCLQLLI